MAERKVVARRAGVAVVWLGLIGGVWSLWLNDEPAVVAEPTPVEQVTARLREVRLNCQEEIGALADRPARQAEVEQVCAERIEAFERELDALTP